LVNQTYIEIDLESELRRGGLKSCPVL